MRCKSPCKLSGPGSVELGRPRYWWVRVFQLFAPGLWLSVRESATTRWTREADDPGARARVERPPRPGGAATLVVC